MFSNLIKKAAIILIMALSVQVWSQSSEALMATGQQMLQNGAYSQAVSAFRKVVGREPDNFEAQFNLGFALLGWGRNGNAIEEFKKALKLQPRNSQVWSNMAIAYENMGKSPEAIGALDNAVKCDPNNITARVNLAAEYANADRYEQAIAQYKQVLAIDGMNEDALVNISKCLISIGKTEEAKNYLKQTTAANPNNANAHCELGNIYLKTDNNADKAISEYKIAISLKPDASYYESLASAYEVKKDKAQAVEVLKKAIVMTDDVLKKDKIQDRIDRLEGKNVTNPTPSVPSEDFSNPDQVNDLKKELREKPESKTKRIETQPVNVMGDLQDLNTEDDSKPIDLKSEAKKKAAQ
jgi:tetratricopeptide (TPR) repeat protein